MLNLNTARRHLLVAFYLGGALLTQAGAMRESDTGADYYRNVLESIRVGEPDAALQEATAYLEKFPQGEHRQKLQVLRLSVLFDQQKYQQIIALVKQLDLGSLGDQQQAVSYMLAGAYCLSGEYSESIAAAKAYFTQWPAGSYSRDVLYFQAVSLARTGYLEPARSAFTRILRGAGRVSEHAPRAHYELALLDFKEKHYELSIKRLSQLHPTLVENKLKLASALLQAQAHAVLRQREQAERVYLDALQRARDAGLTEQEQEVLFYLIDFYSREKVDGDINPQTEKAVPYYEEFFRKFTDSKYAAQVAIVALPALEKAGKLAAGVQQLEQVVQLSCASGEEAGLQRAANGLVWKMIALGSTSAQLHQRWKAAGDTPYSVVMRHALAEVYAAGVRQSEVTWGRKLKFSALRDALYAELSVVVDEVAAPAYVHADLGWWLLENGNFPERASVLFRSAQKSSIWRNNQRAMMGEAAAMRLVNPQNLDAPLALLDTIIASSQQDRNLLELAMYQKIELLHQHSLWQQLTELTLAYVRDEEFTKERAIAYYLLAKSYDKRAMPEEAIAAYIQVFASYTRLVEFSAPAINRLTRLTWQRKRPKSGDEESDRQIAYQLGHRYLSLIDSVETWKKEQESTREALREIAENVAQWERSGEVIPVAELLESLRKSRL